MHWIFWALVTSSIIPNIIGIYYILTTPFGKLTPCTLLNISGERCARRYMTEDVYYPYLIYDATISINNIKQPATIECTNIGCETCDYNYSINSIYNCKSTLVGKIFLSHFVEETIRQYDLATGIIFLIIGLAMLTALFVFVFRVPNRLGYSYI